MTINSRTKGKRGELELAAKLREMGFTRARRGQQFKGTADSPDIAGAVSGLHIECKRVEGVRIHDWFEQALRESGADLPVVMHRKNKTPWLVTLQLEHVEAFAKMVLLELEACRRERMHEEQPCPSGS